MDHWYKQARIRTADLGANMSCIPSMHMRPHKVLILMQLPPVTKVYLTLCFATTVACALEVHHTLLCVP